MELSDRDRISDSYIGDCPECGSESTIYVVNESMDENEQWQETGNYKECIACHLFWDYIDLTGFVEM